MRTKFYRVWSVAILSVSVLIFCVTIFLVLGEASAPQVAIEFVPKTQEVKRGEEFSVGVYFSGRDAANVSSVDLNLVYDDTRLQLEETLAGPYFVQPVTLSSNSQDVSLAAAPGTAWPFNPELSVVRLRFLPLETGEVEVAISAESKVYASGSQALIKSTPAVYLVK